MVSKRLRVNAIASANVIFFEVVCKNGYTSPSNLASGLNCLIPEHTRDSVLSDSSGKA